MLDLSQLKLQLSSMGIMVRNPYGTEIDLPGYDAKEISDLRDHLKGIEHKLERSNPADYEFLDRILSYIKPLPNVKIYSLHLRAMFENSTKAKHFKDFDKTHLSINRNISSNIDKSSLSKIKIGGHNLTTDKNKPKAKIGNSNVPKIHFSGKAKKGKLKPGLTRPKSTATISDSKPAKFSCICGIGFNSKNNF
jgi:hypothetical protein